MFRLTDLYSKLLNKPLSKDLGIAIQALSNEVAVLNHQFLDERVSFFSFSLISGGTAVVEYGDKTINLRKNDLFFSAPEVKIYTKEVSDDYSGLCLIAEEETMYNIPYSRNIISSLYAITNPQVDNVITLSDLHFSKMYSRIKEIEEYFQESNLHKNQILSSLYAVFVLDVLNLLDKEGRASEIPSATSDQFLQFLKLIREHFLRHHELEFYADALNVTTIYLSRIVKRISGHTVKNHIDRLLMMEAAFLLTRTDYPIARIAESLNFANPASFCKFFNRHKGMSPKDYRKYSSIHDRGVI